MVGIRRIVIDIELSVITILDRIGYDFRCRVIMGDHASREMTLGFFDGPAIPVTYTDLDEF